MAAGHQDVAAYGDSDEQRLRLIATIAAMANTRGGTIRVGRVAGGPASLETPTVTEAVNEYVAPRIKGIESVAQSD